jgi:hypothetical protein
MTVSEFRIVLRELPADQAAHVPYEVFAELFPPGEPDDDARERAYRFAKKMAVSSITVRRQARYCLQRRSPIPRCAIV